MTKTLKQYLSEARPAVVGNAREDKERRLVHDDFTKQANMEAFERLHPDVRAALRDSAHNWSAADIERGIKAQRIPPAQMAVMIKQRDQQSAIDWDQEIAKGRLKKEHVEVLEDALLEGVNIYSDC